MTLTKADIITEVMNENGYSRRQATNTVETLLEIIKKNL
ncbi:MAG: HU family DNA-binding protein [Candidatus Desulfatibia sp.]|jgi:nucleoid DNA-binding protein